MQHSAVLGLRVAIAMSARGHLAARLASFVATRFDPRGAGLGQSTLLLLVVGDAAPAKQVAEFQEEGLPGVVAVAGRHPDAVLGSRPLGMTALLPCPK